MPEHFHLLITEPQTGTPSTVMQAVKLGFARRILASTEKRTGAMQPVLRKGHAHVWQRRFYDFNVWTEAKRIEKLRYIPQSRDPGTGRRT